MFNDLLKLAAMSPLAEQVAELTVCPKCHTRTLEEKHSSDLFRAFQCSACGDAWMLRPNT